MKLACKSLRSPRIEMLPLIDVVFLLLVFFIYAMLSMTVHHGQPVELPQLSTAAAEVNEAISVTIQAVGHGTVLFVDEEPVSLERMSDLLREKKLAEDGSHEKEVRIFADRSISYQDLFKVLDSIRQAGFTSISLQADPEGVDNE